ncbi:PLP-dependent aminotransferase family protein [Neobacillus sp. 19]|uniref:MocR-like pyridoxine biosynthesis transcription factor PdxR n=1 Tax=Neobacillus sp. 19 TaxID=3394458 RepID=UPI003BF73BF4
MSERSIFLYHFIFPFNRYQPKYIQIYEQFKEIIESNKISSNERLPSIRSLAETLHVSRNTTLQAYELLLAEGYIRSEEKKGYFVNQLEPFFINPTSPTLEPKIPKPLNHPIDFRIGAIDQEHFPMKKWRQMSNAILKQANSYTYGQSFGEDSFKGEIANYLLQARGLQIKPEQIVVGSNTQQLLLHLSFLLKDIFSSILLENPGYDGAREVFQLQKFQMEAITVTNQGLAMEELPQKESSLFYVTPSHQYPFGTALSIQQRWQLIQWVHQRQGYLIEDDYDGEYRYGQKTFPALASLDATRVIYLGTFSKSFLPAIRLAYMVLPEPLLTSYCAQFGHFEHNASLLHQLTMTEFMKSGEWEKHIKRMRKVYKGKMHFLVEQLKTMFPDQHEVIGTNAGLYVMIKVNTPYSETELIEKALKEHVKVYPTSHLFIENLTTQPHLLLGFANLSSQQIQTGLSLLKKSWDM